MKKFVKELKSLQNIGKVCETTGKSWIAEKSLWNAKKISKNVGKVCEMWKNFRKVSAKLEMRRKRRLNDYANNT